MKSFIVFSFFSAFILSQNVSVGETLLKLSELSLTQDLYNAKTRRTLAEGQVKIAESEWESQVQLHRQLENIHKAQPTAISALEYKQSQIALAVAELNVLETKEIVEATKADEALYQKYLQESAGGKVTANDVAKQYLSIWTARNRAASFVVSKNEAELELAVFERDMTLKLVAKNAVSVRSLILAEGEVAKFEESLLRAKNALEVTSEAMKKFK